jgi:hypothetical protein
VKPLYSQEEYDTAKGINLLPLECYHCGNKFYQQKKYIKSTLKRKLGNCKFCSNACNGKFFDKSITAPCAQCGKSVTRQPKDFKKSKSSKIFCNTSCSAKYTNTHKTKGTRRSKLEVWLEQELTKKYPKLCINYNCVNTINYELDIYIPELKLAFELNGIFHYKPIYGEKKLLKIQNNDLLKNKECRDKSINLLTIDISDQYKFTEASSIKYLNYICFIIYCHMF